jgi:hypothetical protein
LAAAAVRAGTEAVLAAAVVGVEALGIKTTSLLHPEPHTQWLLDQEDLVLMLEQARQVQPVEFLHLTA